MCGGDGTVHLDEEDCGHLGQGGVGPIAHGSCGGEEGERGRREGEVAGKEQRVGSQLPK